MNIVTSNQENMQAENKNPLHTEWQTPVLYKEDWMNTLTGLNPPPPAESSPTYVDRTPAS